MLLLLALSLRLLELLIFARVVVSWVPGWQRQPLGQLVIGVTEPLLQPLRGMIRIGNSGTFIDFAPTIALILIHAVRSMIRF